MQTFSATACASPNIAFIKYWGDRDPTIHLPASGSISMNLAGLSTRTEVGFHARLLRDQLILNNQAVSGAALDRMARFLDHVRQIAGRKLFARVVSENNFPIGAGIASSAAGFAALALAATAALNIHFDEIALSKLARLGSGSACRSIPAGFVEWQAGEDDASSVASTLAPPNHWDLVDCIAIVESRQKEVGSAEGHLLAHSSDIQGCRLESAPHRLAICRRAILNRDFCALADVVEEDSNLMHAVMITSRPPLFYWEPASLAIIKEVPLWRQSGVPACYTLDAGPNVHIITTSTYAARIQSLVLAIPGVQQVLIAAAGEGARLIQ